MKTLLLLLACAGVIQAHDLTGNWQGTLSVGRDLRVVVKVSKGDGAALKASLYSIDLGLKIEVTKAPADVVIDKVEKPTENQQ